MALHPLLTISSSVILSTAACWLVLDPGRSDGSGPAAIVAASDRGEGDLMSQLQVLEKRVEDLLESQAMGAVPVARVAAASPAGSSLSEDSVRDLVRGLVKEDALTGAEDGEIVWPGGHASAADTIRAILDGDVTGEDVAGLWEEAAANGQLHDLLAAMEAEMENVPESADKHFDRARAYYSAAQAMPSNGDGNWWVDSNEAYSSALKYDPQHWEARYQKARNMSFWPVAYGGQAEAVKHFERLADQQESGNVTAGNAANYPKTYVWLGNLYAQQGKTAQARAAWERGLAAFPGDGWLLERLNSLD
ncbi:Tetratricopeptide repeat protein [Planctomycetes bacterium Poly30]|uniref:Tetratricopeptide repeat protein n=1 Tax=Saltatorellus ferox TaxID=2528018 RepID=A0A518EYS2_9BACT|nr:Tetratricopeptide repeat protein [Planctomycetes bacterium Poly30]